jgi:tetratricopeptide (TPR) repeat protein
MTDITLRAYVREIDNLIEQEKLDEAIAHCRHILQTYPKYIDCYRLLGKAYLEAKRFGDAADIFQRVLSAVPDDFVSHIGMSIVREDEGNLDSSIWHMERAFETNPANPAIQQELKRLIGRRDGFEPHKVRLTLGALARMYALGELYPHAIAELRSALKEDRERPDLQVLLADLYWQTDQRLESAEVAGAILQKLPFCLKATRVTAAVLQERGKTDDAASYHRRLAQLDPYMAYIEVPMADTSRVDADSIRLQKLAWKPGQPLPAADTGPSDWAASLGLEEEEVEEISTGPLPSWLGDVEEELSPIEVEAESEPALEMESAAAEESAAADSDADDSAIPAWMQDAGWQESSGEAQEAQVSFTPEEIDALERGEIPSPPPEEEATGDLAPAEIPGWLQGMAPAEDQAMTEAGDEKDEADLAAILGAQPPDDEAVPEDFEVIEEIEAEPESAEMPGWLDEGEPGATSTIMTWLGDRDEEPEVLSGAEDEVEADWIESLDVPSGEEMPAELDEAGEEVPGWLAGVAEAAAGAASSEDDELAKLRRQAMDDQEEEDTSETDQPPDWLQAIAGAPEAEPADMVDEAIVESPWESEMSAAEQETVPEAGLVSAREEVGEDAPSWMAGFADDLVIEESGPDQPGLETEMTEATGGTTEAEEDWLSGLGEETAGDEAVSWLQRLGEEQGEIEETAAIPDWMVGMEDEIPAEGDDEIDDFAASWLDDLSDTLAATPSEPPSAQPAIETQNSLEDAPTTFPEPVMESGRQEAEADDLAWLAALEDQEFEADVASPIESETQAEESPAGRIDDLDELDEEGVFSWLDQMAARQDDAPEGEDEEQAPVTEGVAEVGDRPPPENLEEGLEWLDRLSATRGIDADIEATMEATTPPPVEALESGELQFEPFDVEGEGAAVEAESEVVERPDIGEWETEGPAATSEAPPPPSPDEAPADVELEYDTPEPEVEPDAETIMVKRPREPIPEQELIEAVDEAEPSAYVEEVPEWLREHGEAGVSLEAESEAAPTEPPPAPEEPIAPPEPASAVPDELSESEMPAAEFGEGPIAHELAQLGTGPEEPIPPPATREPTRVEEDVAEAPVSATPAVPEEAPQAETTPLKRARELLDAGEEPAAAAEYARLIRSRQGLPEIVKDLEEFLEREPDVPLLWQTLGDAYMKSNRTKDAVRAYNRGMEGTEVMDSARQALFAGDAQRAAAQYGILIKGKTELDTVIADLENALRSGPQSPILWQTLGDAYMKADRLDDSIRAYRKGMDSV